MGFFAFRIPFYSIFRLVSLWDVRNSIESKYSNTSMIQYFLPKYSKQGRVFDEGKLGITMNEFCGQLVVISTKIRSFRSPNFPAEINFALDLNTIVEYLAFSSFLSRAL